MSAVTLSASNFTVISRNSRPSGPGKHPNDVIDGAIRFALADQLEVFHHTLQWSGASRSGNTIRAAPRPVFSRTQATAETRRARAQP